MDVKEENFKRIAKTRVAKIVDAISKLKDLANKSFYIYTDDQIDEIFNSIQEELNKQKELLKSNNKNSKGIL